MKVLYVSPLNGVVGLSLTATELQLLRSVISAAAHTWRHYPGLNTGKSVIHDVYPEDLKVMYAFVDMLGENEKVCALFKSLQEG